MPEETTSLIPRDAVLAVVGVNTRLAQLQDVVVEDKEQCEAASQYITELKNFNNQLVELRKSLVMPYKEKTNKIEAFFRTPLKALDNAIVKFTDGRSRFLIAEEQKRMAEQRKAQEEADRLQQEKLREAMEAQEQAEKAVEEGDTLAAQEALAKSEAAMEEAQQVVAPVEHELKVTGGKAEKWELTITDECELKKYLAGNKDLQYTLMVNNKELERLQKSRGGTMQLPGAVFRKKMGHRR